MHRPVIIYVRLPAGGTYYPICMFPTNNECWIGISDAFLPFVYGYPSFSPCAHCTPNKSLPILCAPREFLLLNVHGGEKALLGTGTSGKGGQKSETSKQAPTRKTKAAVDRRQNNKMLRQCPSGIAQRPPHHAIAVPTAMQNRVTKTMSVAPPLGNS